MIPCLCVLNTRTEDGRFVLSLNLTGAVGADAERLGLGEAAAEVGEVVGAFGGAAGGGFHEFLRREGGAFGVDFALEPAEEGGGVGFGEGVGDGVVLHGGAEELRRVEVAERVGGEVAKASHGPVDILQAAFGVGGWGHAEEFLEFCVPSLRDVFDFELAVDELAFEREAKKDMEVVGGFVGFDPDEGVLRAIDRGEEGVEVESAEVGEELLCTWKPFLPEGTGAADVIFPEAGLGFVNAKGDGVARGEVGLIGGEALFVESVPGFVEHSEEGGGEVVFVVAGG